VVRWEDGGDRTERPVTSPSEPTGNRRTPKAKRMGRVNSSHANQTNDSCWNALGLQYHSLKTHKRLTKSLTNLHRACDLTTASVMILVGRNSTVNHGILFDFKTQSITKNSQKVDKIIYFGSSSTPTLI
jgi:hypothetical protein